MTFFSKLSESRFEGGELALKWEICISSCSQSSILEAIPEVILETTAFLKIETRLRMDLCSYTSAGWNNKVSGGKRVHIYSSLENAIFFLVSFERSLNSSFNHGNKDAL